MTSFFQKCTTLEHQLAALRAEAEGAGANQLRWGDEDEFATPARGALVGAGAAGAMRPDMLRLQVQLSMSACLTIHDCYVLHFTSDWQLLVVSHIHVN